MHPGDVENSFVLKLEDGVLGCGTVLVSIAQDKRDHSNVRNGA